MAHTPDWALFPGNIDGHPAWISADIAYGESPDSSRTHFIDVRFALPDCNDEGLPGQEGLDLIEQVEDALLPILEERFKALHVGSVSHQRVRHVYFYAPTDKGLAEALRPLAAIFPGSPPSAVSQPDPQAERYVQILMPDDWQVEFVQNHRVCEALAAAGDDGQADRAIEHLAVFNDPLSRDRFAQRVADMGYNVQPTDDADVDPDDPVYAVAFHHAGPVDPFELTERTYPLAELAAEHDGEYDGWQARPITS